MLFNFNKLLSECAPDIDALLSNIGNVWFGLSSTNNPSTVNEATLTNVNLVGNDLDFDVNIVLAQSQYLIILVPSGPMVNIMDTILGSGDVTASFEYTPNVRTIGAVQIDSYVEGPISADADGLTSGFTVNFVS